jgi:molecular chaperone DnaK
LKKAYESKDVAVIEPALEKINEAWKNASEEMYKAQAEAQQAGDAQPGPDAGLKKHNQVLIVFFLF